MRRALQEAWIRAHQNLVTLLWGRLSQVLPQWDILCEMSFISLPGVEASLDCCDEWQRAMSDLFDLELDGPDGDPSLGPGLLHKHPDRFAKNWGSKTALVLKFACAFDIRADLHTVVDKHKTERYTPLRN